MSNLVVEIIGYSAAIITNISVYPQAYEVYIITSTGEYNKLNSLSITTFSLQTTGCIFWFIYALIQQIFPIIFGSILCLIPSSYILINLIYYNRPSISHTIEQSPDQTEIIIASGSVYPIQEVLSTVQSPNNISLNIDTDMSIMNEEY